MKTWLDLTDAFPFKFDVERLKAELSKIDENRLLDHYDPTLDRGWRAALLVSKRGEMSGPESQRPAWITDAASEFKRTPLVEQLPYFREILDFFKCPQGRVRILKLAPGAGIGLHTDRFAEVGCLAFNQVRLHVPIVTNDKVTFHVGGEVIKMSPGRLYYVNFSKPHWVRNDGATARYHLVLDLKVNDWLRQFFPKTSAWEEIEFAVARTTWPSRWRLYKVFRRWYDRTWTAYAGSPAQRLVRRVKTAI